MKANEHSHVIVVLRSVLIGLAFLYAAAFLCIAALRIGYPFELEWMEGACVDHVCRILTGQKLYVSPSLNFVPFIYPPLYFYFSAGVAKLIGVGFLALRLVSFISSLGCFALVFLMARRQARSFFAGVLAMGLFAACYGIGGFWYDIGRVDMLSLVLLLAAMYLVQLDRGWSQHFAAGVLISLAFLTKQTALAVVIPLMVYAIVSRPKRGLVFVLSSLALCGTAILILDRLHQGWYSYYVFELPRGPQIDIAAARAFWTSDMISVIPIALVGVAFFLAESFRRDRRSFFLWGAVTLGAVGAAWSGRAHAGGYNNVVIPAYAVISVVFGLAVESALAGARGRTLLIAGVYLLCITQFLRLAYDPIMQVPTLADRRAGEEIVSAMKAIPGDVYMPYHGYLPVMAGKRSYAHAMAIFDVTRGRGQGAKDSLIGEVIGAIREQRFAAVITDTDVFAQPDLDAYYLRNPIDLADDIFYPVTGMRTRPKYLCRPRR